MGNLTKVSMNLSHRSIANVEEISNLIGEKNKTRVVSTSLEMTKVFLNEIKNGKKLILRSDNGDEQEVFLVFNV